jgi:AcrR family transcriptional regulator
MTNQTRNSARERLLTAADEIFYAEGVNTVGIDRVIEQAGVAKASLYRLFGSKEELVAAYLGARHERLLAELRSALDQQQAPLDRILTVFDVQARWFRRSSYRGCAFARASAEPAIGARVQRATDAYRDAIRGLFTELATTAGARKPEVLAGQLHTLYHGADILISSGHRDRLIGTTRAAVETLVAAAL